MNMVINLKYDIKELERYMIQLRLENIKLNKLNKALKERKNA